MMKDQNGGDHSGKAAPNGDNLWSKIIRWGDTQATGDDIGSRPIPPGLQLQRTWLRIKGAIAQGERDGSRRGGASVGAEQEVGLAGTRVEMKQGGHARSGSGWQQKGGRGVGAPTQFNGAARVEATTVK
ncbi:unnamed protein product [Calypogeia fissa]